MESTGEASASGFKSLQNAENITGAKPVDVQRGMGSEQPQVEGALDGNERTDDGTPIIDIEDLQPQTRESKETPEDIRNQEAHDILTRHFMSHGKAAKDKFDSQYRKGMPPNEHKAILSNSEQATYVYYGIKTLQPGSTMTFLDGGILLDPLGDNQYAPAQHGSIEIMEIAGSKNEGFVKCTQRGKTDPIEIPTDIILKAQLLSQRSEFSNSAAEGTATRKVMDAYIDSIESDAPMNVEATDIAEAGRENGMITAESGQILIGNSDLSDEQKAQLIKITEGKITLSPQDITSILLAVDPKPAQLTEITDSLSKNEAQLKVKREALNNTTDEAAKAAIQHEISSLEKQIAEDQARSKLLKAEELDPEKLINALGNIYLDNTNPEMMASLDEHIRNGQLKEFVEALIPQAQNTEQGKKIAHLSGEFMKYGLGSLAILAILLMGALEQ